MATASHDLVCRKCSRLCKNKHGLAIHQNACLRIEDGQSFLINERYLTKKAVNNADKVLPLSQPMIGFDDAISKVSQIVSNYDPPISLTGNVPSPTGVDHSPTTGCGTEEQELMNTIDKANKPPQVDNTNTITQPNLPRIEIFPIKGQVDKDFRGMTQKYIFEKVNAMYDQIVHFRRNLFNIPSGSAGKEFIKELVFWMKQFNSNSNLNGIALKVYMILPSVILQKPSANSKAKDHSKAIERRLALWKSGDIESLLTEIRFIQEKFISSTKRRDNEDISKIFAKLVIQGKLSAALKFLDKESNGGVLNLSKEVLNDLHEKHPPAEPIMENSLLYGPIRDIPPSIFEMIDEQLIMKVALQTKGSAGPSGADADLYKRILCSKNFNAVGKELREEIAIMTRNLLTTNYDHSLVESYVACRLIPLNKNPGIRPIGVGEVLRRIVGKAVTWTLKEVFCESAGPLQTCAGHQAGAEAAIHGLKAVFEDKGTDASLLVDASNAFNRMNRLVGMHNIRITCPEVSTYIINTYRSPSRLFITGGGEILSQEGTTQGDPLAMPWYAINTRTLIDRLRMIVSDVKQAWLADDSAGGGSLRNLHEWFLQLSSEGEKYGYYVNGSKSWLIVKNADRMEEASKIFGTTVKITKDGKRHLGAVIGSPQYKDEYCEKMVDGWMNELENLTEVAKSQPQAAYIALTKAYKSKFTYFMRTINGFEKYVNPIDSLLNEKFLPTIFDSDSPFEKPLSDLFTLSPKLGGLGIPSLERDSPRQFEASKLVTENHVNSIIEQSPRMKTPERSWQTVKSQLQQKKNENAKSMIKEIDDALPSKTLRQVNQARDKGASLWLNAIPYEQHGFNLNKQEFRDSIRLRYDMRLKDLPQKCACDEVFSVEHALSCKKGGFVAQRHDNVKNMLVASIAKVCKNVQSEPRLLPLDNESFNLRSANTSEEARLDIKAGGFWSRGVNAFFDVRVTHVNSRSNQDKSTDKIFEGQEKEKKRQYNQRVIDVEHGTFTPLVFGTNGGFGKECEIFIAKLAEKLSFKSDESYASVITWLRM